MHGEAAGAARGVVARELGDLVGGEVARERGGGHRRGERGAQLGVAPRETRGSELQHAVVGEQRDESVEVGTVVTVRVPRS